MNRRTVLFSQPTLGGGRRRRGQLYGRVEDPGEPGEVTWEYDEEADVLYLSVGKPRPAVGVDIGEGVTLRYDETQGEVVGLTFVGLRRRLLENLPQGDQLNKRADD